MYLHHNMNINNKKNNIKNGPWEDGTGGCRTSGTLGNIRLMFLHWTTVPVNCSSVPVNSSRHILLYRIVAVVVPTCNYYVYGGTFMLRKRIVFGAALPSSLQGGAGRSGTAVQHHCGGR
jgi:hypothetical protein